MFSAADYGNNLNQDVNIPSVKKKVDCNDKTRYCPTSIKESLNWLHFCYNEIHCRYGREIIKILLSFLNLFKMFKIKCWYSTGGVEVNIS